MKKMKDLITNLIKRIPAFITTGDYWERRYAMPGNSGDGSYGRLAQFKAEVIESFIKKNAVHSVAEFGCGDGHQLGLINYPHYTGFDISASAVDICQQKYKNDSTKKFFLNTEENIQKLYNNRPEMCLSLDVLYHLVENSLFENYLRTLFDLAQNYTIIYSTDMNKVDADHVVHRKFTDWVKDNKPNWVLLEYIENPYLGVGEQESNANFYIYKKQR